MSDPRIVSVPFSLGDLRGTIRMHDIHGCDQVVSQIVKGGWSSYEAPLPMYLALFSAIEKSCFLDIGANTGYYSILAAVAGAKDVRSYEPVPEIADLMRLNVAHTFGRGYNGIRIFNVAISDACGDAELFIPDGSHGLVETSSSLNPFFKSNIERTIRVKSTTIDHSINPENTPLNSKVFIKIDVEGHEKEVLLGAEKTVECYRPPIFLEILPGADLDFYERWAREHEYLHFKLTPPDLLKESYKIEADPNHRDHLLLPKEYRLEQILINA